MLGTTHATNAVLERTRLNRVAVIRIAGPATNAIRPLFGWPADLRAAVSAGAIIVGGGIEFDGRDITPLDTEAIRKFCLQIAGDVDGLAITSNPAGVLDDARCPGPREGGRRAAGFVGAS
jgi:N-methylhydantoinase A/oxoprolinase/acetone carboxylase beta subunit